MYQIEHKAKPFKYFFVCSNCKESFGANRKDAKACSEKCQKALQRAKSQPNEKKLKRFLQSPFGSFLADSAKRAKTLEVIPHTLPALIELHSIYSYALRANGFGAGRDFSICHIAPVAGKTHVGTIYPQNLVVAPTKQNAGFGNKWFRGAGHRLLKVKLNPCNAVDERAPASSTLARIVQYLGLDLVGKLITKCNLQPSKKQGLLDWFSTQFDDRIPALEVLKDMKAPQLTALKDEITGKRSFSMSAYVYNIDTVFQHELSRLRSHYPHLQEVSALYTDMLPSILRVNWELTRNYDKPTGSHKGFLQSLQQRLLDQQFLVLHGAPAEDFMSVLTDINGYVKRPVVEQPRWLPVRMPGQAAPDFLDEDVCNLWGDSPLDEATAPVNAGENSIALGAPSVHFMSVANAPSKVTSPECSAFTQDDIQELEALEQAAGMQSYLADEYVPEFSEAELEAAFRGQRHKHTSQTTLARFLSG